jgi:hypothetical protein
MQMWNRQFLHIEVDLAVQKPLKEEVMNFFILVFSSWQDEYSLIHSSVFKKVNPFFEWLRFKE